MVYGMYAKKYTILKYVINSMAWHIQESSFKNNLEEQKKGIAK